MNDREFLMWIHERLEHVHKESSSVDYMHKLRAVIKATPPGQITPNNLTANSLAELQGGTMQTQVTTNKTISLHLTEYEANWLKERMQNHLGAGKEDQKDSEMRLLFFETLKGALE